jgi:hypothetical protein
MSNDLIETQYGWAVKGFKPPRRTDVNWLKLPEETVYFFDGDGWYRMDGSDFKPCQPKDLPHG